MILFKPKHFPAGEASHLPVLEKVLRNSEGTVLELGTGFFSTSFLHWICNDMDRKLISYESDERFVEVAKNFMSDWHELHWITDWDELDLEHNKWGVIFIDHAPGKRRHVELARAVNSADYVIVHDSEAKSDWHYNFSKGFPLYKYRFDYTKAYPHTSVLSNFKDPNELWK